MVTTLRKPKSKRTKAKTVKPLPTIWEVSDDLWQRILPILEDFWPTQPTGRHHANWRKAINGILFRMRSGCQWDHLPRRFGPKSTVHDWFQRWCQGGILQRIWAELAAECDELGGRDHWGAAGSIFFAGGGTRGGQVLGATDRNGAFP